MIEDAILSYAHFVFVFLVAGTLVAEAFVIRLPQGAQTIKLLARIDLFYGISAGLVVVAGFARVFMGLKGPDYYWAEPFFWVKLAAFALVGLMSIAPTLKFLAWRKAIRTDESFAPPAGEVKAVRRLLMIELHIFALIPLFAALMARDIRL
jgi:putative membrane protein